MFFPVAFTVGLAVLVLAPELCDMLPGSGSLTAMALCLLLLALPVWVARLADGVLQRRLRRGRDPGRMPFLALRLLPAMVPTIYFVLLTEGTLLDLSDQWAGGSSTLRTLFLVLPLALLDGSRLLAEQFLRRQLDRAGFGVPTLLVRDYAAMTGFLLAPLLLFGVALDLVGMWRSLEVFLVGTSLGVTIGIGAFLLVLSALLPVLFRVLMGTTRELPRHLAFDLRATAERLGFPIRGLLGMRTGHRMINAAMVGPLPWPRYLVLTDGLMSILDPLALRGVVAHEIGHARAGHPGWLMMLFVVVPLLLVQPLQHVSVDHVGFGWMALLVVGGMAVVVFSLRLVAHRFEYEADVLSAEALGGASPCVTALQRVGQLTQQNVRRSSLRHPSEVNRVLTLQRWEADPDFRARFHVAGRRLRYSIFALMVSALGFAAWSWWAAWPVERAVWLFYTGDVPTARAQITAATGAVRSSQWEWWLKFQGEVEAAAQIAPDGGDWALLAPRLAEAGWQRGIATLVADGPAKARPWFALATEDDAKQPLRECLLRYCDAAYDGNAAEMARLHAHIATLPLPAALLPVFR